ncbi:Coenzyme F420 hydrogenase/dehydrogenase, beta subunit C-terminal domain [Paracoccus shandongensis]|uniref:Coenzyme F420 hydrogenase/dehydrogenase, beta subunit C-terminal domain n=1 Tax=Paracoccus shandongensis TaxID=2816048 RepID=UPI001A8D29D7|nr:Coenzyme F420 hydrogenase/dehydrogenase, beta subunit C-terminal domain [Paracoccus shandongensis]
MRSKGGDKSVEGWLAAFRNADYVVTDSFHGVAFFLIFNRLFVAYGNAERGLARFRSLLRAVGLEDRLIVISEGADAEALMQPIDWPAVNRRLDALRSRSLQFLVDALSSGQDGGGKGGDMPEGRQVRQPEPAPIAAGEAIPVSETDHHPLDLHCTGCGACVSESGGALRMAWTPDGFLEPRATGTLVPKGVARVCPFNPAPEAAVRDEDAIARDCLPDAGRHDPRIGRFVNTYVGFSKAFRPSSSSGGIATFVFEKLLEQGEVDHLFVVRRTLDGQYAYRMFDRNDDILTTSRTRYYPVTMEQLFLTMDPVKGRVAVSGVACFVKAIRLKQHYDPALREKIPLLAGIICGGLKSRFYTDFLAQSAGVRGPYRDAEYRVKSPASLSSDYSFAATDADGHAGQVRMQKLGDMWGTGLFKSRACDFCTDVMTELADISLGDAWLPEYKQDGMGNSVVVTRSLLADRIIRQGMADGELELKEVSPDIAARTQSGGFNHKQKAVKFRLLSEELSGDRKTPFVRPRVLTDSSVAEMVVQVLRNRTRARSLRVWRQTRDNRAFMRHMRACLRSLSAATGARKQSAQVDGDAFGVLDRPGQGAARRGEVAAVRAALVLLDRRVTDGTVTPDILGRALGRYAQGEPEAHQPRAD